MPHEEPAPFADDATVSRRPDILGSNVDGEIVLMSAQHQSYFGLDEIGSAIWRALAEPIRVDALITVMAQQFNGEPAQIAADTRVFLASLLDRQLIAVQASQIA